MKGLFVNLTSVNVSAISEKKTSATYHKSLLFVRIYKLR